MTDEQLESVAKSIEIKR